MLISVVGEPLVHDSHKKLCERWGDGYGPVIIKIVLVSFAFI